MIRVSVAREQKLAVRTINAPMITTEAVHSEVEAQTVVEASVAEAVAVVSVVLAVSPAAPAAPAVRAVRVVSAVHEAAEVLADADRNH